MSSLMFIFIIGISMLYAWKSWDRASSKILDKASRIASVVPLRSIFCSLVADGITRAAIFAIFPFFVFIAFVILLSLPIAAIPILTATVILGHAGYTTYRALQLCVLELKLLR